MSNLEKLYHPEVLAQLSNPERIWTTRESIHHFEYITNIIVRKFRTGIKFKIKICYDEKSKKLAYTNFYGIYINVANELIKSKKTVREQYGIMLGLLLHEISHILWTDPNMDIMSKKSISSGYLYPDDIDLKDLSFQAKINLEDIKYFIKNKKNAKLFYRILDKIDARLEDGFIENAAMENVPGIAKEGLYELRDIFYENFAIRDSVSIPVSENYIINLMNVSLFYAKYKEIPNIPYSEKFIGQFLENSFLIDKFVKTYHPKKRKYLSLLFIIHMWHFIYEEAELAKKDQNLIEEEQPEEDLQEDDPNFEKSSTNTPPLLGDKNPAKQNLPEEKPPEEQESEESEESEDTNQNKSESDENKSTGDNLDDDFDDLDDDFDDQDEPDQEILNESLQKLLKPILNEISKENDELERLQDLKKQVQDLDKSDVNKDIKYIFNREVHISQELVDKYDEEAKRLMGISSNLKFEIVRKIKKRSSATRTRNLSMGPNINFNSFLRNDGKCFSKLIPANKNPKIAIVCIGDESGSMEKDERYLAVRDFFIIFYDFCKSINFPIAMYGHTADTNDEGDVVINSYVEFDEIDGNDKYRLMNIRPRDYNRDGAVLQYGYEKLLKRKEDIKILIIVSDGKPNASDYRYQVGIDDTAATVKKYTEKGIITFAASIGDDKEKIKEIYKEGFLDVSIMSDLPKIFTELLSRYI